MTDGLLIAMLVEMWCEKSLVEAEMLVQKLGEVGFGRLDGGEHLHAVAGGDDHAFADAGLSSQGAGGIRQLIAGDGDAFAQLDGRGLVVNPDENELAHGAPNLWTWLTVLAAQTQSMTIRTAPER